MDSHALRKRSSLLSVWRPPVFGQRKTVANDSAPSIMLAQGRDVDMSKKARWPVGIVGRLAVVLLTAFILAGCHRRARIIIILPSTAWESQEIWKQAAQQVEEDRNEPMGSKAAVTVPEELRQYANRHQFLGTQVAESR